MYYNRLRAAGRSENMGVPVILGGHNLPLLVEIGLTDLQSCHGTHGTQTPDTHVAAANFYNRMIKYILS